MRCHDLSTSSFKSCLSIIQRKINSTSEYIIISTYLEYRSMTEMSESRKRKVLKGNHCAQPSGSHTSPRTSSLLERMELPSEERSLLNRRDLNEEAALSIHINDGSSDSVKGWNTRNSRSQQHTNTSSDLPSQNSPLVCCWQRAQSL